MADELDEITVATGLGVSAHPVWLDYWNNYRGEQGLIEGESSDYVARLTARVPLDRAWTVLDFGCGSAVAAALLAPHVSRICLWDASLSARERSRIHVSSVPNVELICLDRADRDPEQAFNLILVNSVIQYMTVPEFEAWTRRWATMLAPNGAVVLSDMPTSASRFTYELFEFLRFALRRGVVLHALRHGLRDVAAYRAARSTSPLLLLDQATIEELCRAAGLCVEFVPNLTFRRHRLSAILRAASVDRLASSPHGRQIPQSMWQ